MEKYIINLEELIDYIFNQIEELDVTSVFDDPDYTRYRKALVLLNTLHAFLCDEEKRERIEV